MAKEYKGMKEMEFSVQDIRELMEAMRRSRIGELKITKGDFSLELEAARETAAVPAPLSPPDTAQPAAEQREYTGQVVKSPLVGAYYAAPAPDKEPYIRVGDRVEKGDVLFIIESMKLMNEVTSDYSGIITEILAENGQGVEYGQPILVIE
jgi:acetyl-CoA carboxylase biotin carboxyl carrier protein